MWLPDMTIVTRRIQSSSNSESVLKIMIRYDKYQVAGWRTVIILTYEITADFIYTDFG